MRQIVYGLLTRGNMDFDEITPVVPWIELAHDMGIDIYAKLTTRARAFKSHLDWEQTPKGGSVTSMSIATPQMRCCR